ncbi:MAG: DUF115 domain-containing protein [Desulfobulbaceae bacterium]|nr:DUF115 domain-containing protein [Desulfobulbaceae bacterium]
MQGTENGNFFDANMAVLKEYQPQVWQYLQETSPEPLGEIVVAPTGKLNLKVLNNSGQEIFLHDVNNPEEEVPIFLDMIPEDSTGFVTLIGMGLGYTPLALLEQRPHIRHLAVFDLQPGIFLQALHHQDLSAMLSDRRLMLSISPQPNVTGILAPVITTLLVEAIHTLKHMPSFSVDAEAYEELSDQVFSFVNDWNVGGATVFAFGETFMANRLANMTTLPHHSIIDKYKDAFIDVPAILVAGGPSLDKNIDVLSRAQGRAVIIAVDTVLPKLLKHNIQPNFVTSIDMEEFTNEKMVGSIPLLPKKNDITLVCSSWVTPNVPKIFPAANVCWTFTGRPIENWVNSLCGGSISLPGAKTVAHLSLQTALVMGCSPIIFTGQDLAFSDEKDHAADTVLTNRTAMMSQLGSEDVLWVEGVVKEKVPTNRAFFSMKSFFESTIANCSQQFINATEGGAHIKGTEIKSLLEVIDEYCHIDQVDRQIQEIEAQEHNGASVLRENLAKGIMANLAKVKSLKKVIKKTNSSTNLVKKELAKLRGASRYTSFASLPQNLRNHISKVNQGHDTLDKDSEFWSLLEEITLEGFRQSERHLHAISLLEGKPEKYIEWLTVNLKRLEEINTVRSRVLAIFEKHLSRVLHHFQTEMNLLKQLEKAGDDINLTMELVRLYMAAEDFVLARAALVPLKDKWAESAEINFQLGVIAAHQGEFEKVDMYFAHSCARDSDFEDEVGAFRQKMGDTYLRYAVRLQSDGYDIGGMVIKGLRYCNGHEKLRAGLQTLLAADLTKIETAAANDDLFSVQHEIEFWTAELGQHENLRSFISKAQQLQLYRYHGELNAKKEDFAKASESFLNAVALNGNDPDLHLKLADSFFAAEDFGQGVAHLDEAVRIDRQYGRFWENIGDNLFKSGQPEDAIAAYERCLLALPEQLFLLKKIGDCYMEMDQPQAAFEAYRQLKDRMQPVNGSESPTVPS